MDKQGFEQLIAEIDNLITGIIIANDKRLHQVVSRLKAAKEAAVEAKEL